MGSHSDWYLNISKWLFSINKPLVTIYKAFMKGCLTRPCSPTMHTQTQQVTARIRLFDSIVHATVHAPPELTAATDLHTMARATTLSPSCPPLPPSPPQWGSVRCPSAHRTPCAWRVRGQGKKACWCPGALLTVRCWHLYFYITCVLVQSHRTHVHIDQCVCVCM